MAANSVKSTPPEPNGKLPSRFTVPEARAIFASLNKAVYAEESAKLKVIRLEAQNEEKRMKKLDKELDQSRALLEPIQKRSVEETRSHEAVMQVEQACLEALVKELELVGFFWFRFVPGSESPSIAHVLH
ncbi:hypothetical protein B0H19DRAFT_1382013 [Mycena capillaripes]|nr:hypothetical protein B0H19DRAFT_1382013 [Mycena capillaripes]